MMSWFYIPYQRPKLPSKVCSIKGFVVFFAVLPFAYKLLGSGPCPIWMSISAVMNPIEGPFLAVRGSIHNLHIFYTLYTYSCYTLYTLYILYFIQYFSFWEYLQLLKRFPWPIFQNVSKNIFYPVPPRPRNSWNISQVFWKIQRKRKWPSRHLQLWRLSTQRLILGIILDKATLAEE